MDLFIDFILHSGIFSSFLLLYVLWKNGKKEFHFRVLFIIFLWICLTLICFYGFINESKMLFFATFLFQDTIPVSIGPCLYLYSKAIFYPSRGMLRKNSIHFLVPVLYLLFASIPKLLSLYQSPEVFGHLREGLENLWALSNINSLVYCFLSIQFLKKTNRIVELYYANMTSADLSWLLKLLYSVIIIFGIDVSITLYEVFIEDTNAAVGIIAIFVVFSLIYLAYHGVSQTKVFLPEFLFKKDTSESKLISKKKILTEITNTTDTTLHSDIEEMKSLQRQLDTFMDKHKWYLRTDLSLKFLSEKLGISDKKLSYILNQIAEVSFFDYVNRFRVEEVKKKIKDPAYAKYTLLGIAYECGFNSKTSFNRTFQRFEGITPSQFKNQNIV
ncbi:AraC family transcriptional regulator [Aquimarina sp. U1-2]|uniref:helix-turn-helix domain-containing protein n=1 Tax=Aquimarina sp. U1-2 TaxID=2823141 RepID=UPI001AECCA99|nr:helix-turn-helix domain-containing protein [Aquimarina sp. U1-2]MBP2831700.1 AraC family transcriptional regulator [Aquimarina sp. U1-2]